MIEISSTTALMIYLCLTLGSLLAVWGFHHYFTRNKKITIADQEVFVCEFCHFCYLGEYSKQITRCPQCHSLNKGRQMKNL